MKPIYKTLVAVSFAAGMFSSALAATEGKDAAVSDASKPVEIIVEKPYIKWLFGGFGFQHSEANFTALMSDEFLNQRALKTFREISPSFGRTVAGFADASKEQMDRFARYYDLTFRLAGTTLYVYPFMPAFPDKIDIDKYAENVALNLSYLIKEKGCRKIRFYCITNELGCGDKFAYFERENKMDLFKAYNAALYKAFAEHGLDIKLLATDIAATTKPYDAVPSIEWAIKEMNDYVGAYCTHWYVYGRRADDLGLYKEYLEYFDKLVQLSRGKYKRYILGEFGFCPVWGKSKVMVDDVSFYRRQPETATESVLAKLEIGLAAMNAGAFACVSWSFLDYPDPFVIEDGDSPKERAVYDAGKYGYKMDLKYNKWGAFRWDSADKNYSSYAELYAMGYLAKLFRKNGAVLPSHCDDSMLRTGAITNPDGSVSIIVINRGPGKSVKVKSAQKLSKPLRMYVYEADNVPYNEFNDLQPARRAIKPENDTFETRIPAKSACFFTTDYIDRVPSPIQNLRIDGGTLKWDKSADAQHCYYRVYKNAKQIASTVAEYLPVKDDDLKSYSVKSVDKWGNCAE